MHVGMLATFRLQFPRRGQGARYQLLGSTVPIPFAYALALA
jgi:hypothetical protein